MLKSIKKEGKQIKNYTFASLLIKKQIAIMKKVLFFLPMLMIGLLFTSCSSDDDDSTTTTTDPIIGTWKMTSETKNGIEVPAEDIAEALAGKTIFNADGTYTSEDYETKSDGTLFLDRTISGTWKNTDGIYTLIIKDNPNTTKDESEILTRKIVFSSDKKTFTYTSINSDNSKTYVTTYTRQ